MSGFEYLVPAWASPLDFKSLCAGPDPREVLGSDDGNDSGRMSEQPGESDCIPGLFLLGRDAVEGVDEIGQVRASFLGQDLVL